MQYVSGDPQSLADAKAKSALYRENQDKIRAQEEAQKTGFE